MARGLKTVLVLLLLFALIGGASARRHASSVIGKGPALEIALGDAGLTRAQTYDKEVDYEHGYYKVEFETGARTYCYLIDAHTGEILNAAVV